MVDILPSLIGTGVPPLFRYDAMVLLKILGLHILPVALLAHRLFVKKVSSYS